MADYQLQHSGEQIDAAVESVLAYTNKIDSVKSQIINIAVSDWVSTSSSVNYRYTYTYSINEGSGWDIENSFPVAFFYDSSTFQKMTIDHSFGLTSSLVTSITLYSNSRFALRMNLLNGGSSLGA